MPNNFDLPEWTDLGGEQPLNISPFVDALKKRMATKPSGGLGTSLENAISNPLSEPSYSSMLSKAPAKGMKSL